MALAPQVFRRTVDLVGNVLQGVGVAYLEDGASAAVAPAGKGGLRYNHGATRFEVSVSGGAWGPLAAAVAVPAGQIPYGNGGGTGLDSEAALVYDATNNFVGIGTATPRLLGTGSGLTIDGGAGFGVIEAKGAATAGTSTFAFLAGLNGTDWVVSMEMRGDGAAGTGALVINCKNGSFTEGLSVTGKGNVVVGGAGSMAQTVTDGFLYLRGTNGPPTGDATDYGGRIALAIDALTSRPYVQLGSSWTALAFLSDVPSLAGYVPTTRTISTTAPLSGGGDLSANRTLSISTNGIDNTLLRQGGATSVIGRSANSTGNVADIAASADGQFLRRASGALGFGAIAFSDLTGVAPNDPQFLTLATNATLTQERVFTLGTGLSGVDGGAGAAYTVTNQVYTGRAGNQAWFGGTAATDTLTISSTAHATKTKIFLNAAQTIAVDEANLRLGIGTAAPAQRLHVYGSAAAGYVGEQIENASAAGYAFNAWFAGVQIGGLQAQGLSVAGTGAGSPGTFLIFNHSDANGQLALASQGAAGTITFYLGGFATTNLAATITATKNVLIGTDVDGEPETFFASNARFLKVSSSIANRAGVLILENASSSPADGDNVGGVEFTAPGQTATHRLVAAMGVRMDGGTANQRGGAIDFYVKPNASASVGRAMTITSASFVGIGISPPIAPLHIHRAAAADVYIHLTNTTSGSTVNDGFDIGTDGSTSYLIAREGPLDFYSSGTFAGRLSTAQNLLIGTTSDNTGTRLRVHAGTGTSNPDVLLIQGYGTNSKIRLDAYEDTGTPTTETVGYIAFGRALSGGVWTGVRALQLWSEAITIQNTSGTDGVAAGTTPGRLLVNVDPVNTGYTLGYGNVLMVDTSATQQNNGLDDWRGIILGGTSEVAGSTFTLNASGINSTIYAIYVPAAKIYAAASRTVTTAVNLYIKDAVNTAGSATITTSYAVWVDAGLSRFDGNGTHVFELPADATGNTTNATGRVPIKVGGNTKYLRYFDS